MFEVADRTIQMILGSYDAQQGQQNGMSGAAIQAGATQSNNASRPYIVNYAECMNQVLTILVDLFPKYITTARTIPIVNRDGQRDFIRVNDSVQNPQYKLEYEINDLQVEVQMNATFEVQRAKFLDTVTNLMKICPPINEFVASPDGIMLILDNIEIKDISLFKEKFSAFYQQRQAQKQQQQQIAMQMNPEVNKLKIAQMTQQSKQQELQLDMQNKEKDRQAELLKTSIQMHMDSQKVQAMNNESEAKIIVAQNETAISAQRATSENQRSLIDGAIALDKHAYSKFESDRAHGLEQSKHTADILKTIGELSNEKDRNDAIQSKRQNEGKTNGFNAESEGEEQSQESESNQEE
jgi:hypothetical protein